MKFPLRWQQLKDISISRKLYFVVGAMAVLIVLELLTLWFSIHTLSSVRALVGAEGFWSKSQKDAIYQLEKYYRTHDEADYSSFLLYMQVPQGDHKTRMEMLKPNPDIDILRQGFIEGKNHPDDVDGMIKILKRFSRISYINDAITYWTSGDSIIDQFMVISKQMHDEINSPSPSSAKLNSLIESIDPINRKLTVLEDNFSTTLGEGSRWLENLILKLLFIVALTVEITGLLLTISISHNITKGLNEINRASNKIARGDLTERATVFSKDEIGQVAVSINEMTERLVRSNIELEQFAHVASHDLQEPLRKIQTYSNMLMETEVYNFSPEARDHFLRMHDSARRMQLLIKNLLAYSQIANPQPKLQDVDLNKILENVKEDFLDIIDEKKITIESDKLPVLSLAEYQFHQLFANLMSNSFKYLKPDKKGLVKISYTLMDISNETIPSMKKGSYHRIIFSDNGIGFDPQYSDKIFEMFQRLHSRTEYSGTGIGLTICKKIVQNHGGTIIAKGDPGEGAIFEIYLPA